MSEVEIICGLISCICTFLETYQRTQNLHRLSEPIINNTPTMNIRTITNIRNNSIEKPEKYNFPPIIL
jgi:hypothetical protein